MFGRGHLQMLKPLSRTEVSYFIAGTVRISSQTHLSGNLGNDNLPISENMDFIQGIFKIQCESRHGEDLSCSLCSAHCYNI